MYTEDDLLNIVKRINDLDSIMNMGNIPKERYDECIDKFIDMKTDLMKDWRERFNNDDTARFALDNALDLYGVIELYGDERYTLNVYIKNRVENIEECDILEFESVILHNLRWVFCKKESDAQCTK